jgi:putative FmdB family regulatory protein
MPIYEYRCEGCGHETEELQKLADAPLTECPKCGKPALVRLVSAAGFQLKGTGWYQTDFRGKARKSDDPKGSDGAPAAAADASACTPTGCEKPGCAAKTDAA